AMPELRDAMDFRGDVELTLKDDATRVGYLFNLDADGGFVEMFPAKEAGVWTIPTGDIAGVKRVGRDPADGKSWEAWVHKYNENQARRKAGEEVAPVGLYPDND